MELWEGLVGGVSRRGWQVKWWEGSVGGASRRGQQTEWWEGSVCVSFVATDRTYVHTDRDR